MKYSMKNMKNKIAAIPAALLSIVFICSSCGAGGSTEPASPSGSAETGRVYADEGESVDFDGSYIAPDSGLASGGAAEAGTGADLAQKIIYSATAEIETTAFDDTVSDVYAMLVNIGGFVENSYITGIDYSASYYKYQTYRSAEFTIRVPGRFFDSLPTELSGLGHVLSLRTGATNVTAQYLDTESRLNTYRAEEGRLLAMLEKAENVEDMIAIESRISNVRYEIEALTSALRNWQNEVDYSTVDLYIREVAELSEETPVETTYWSEVGSGFAATVKGIGSFFKSVFKYLIIALPVLVVLAAIAAIALVIAKKKRKNEADPPHER
jgi:large-conductance mechanosensitive channel